MFDPLLAEPRSFINVVFTQRSGRKAGQDVIPGRDRCHSLGRCIQTASGLHPASSAIDNVSCFSGGRAVAYILAPRIMNHWSYASAASNF
jgi:hypothetical protein